MELLVVVFILAGLVGLLLPAIQSAREKAREAVCKNNLQQMNLAIANFTEAHKRLPAQSSPEVLGGWTIEVLPFLELSNLEYRVPYGAPIADAPNYLLQPPPIFRCPARVAIEDTQESRMQSGHYVFHPTGKRESYSVSDAPLKLDIPWASGPEMRPGNRFRQGGPHNGGFFYVRGFQQGIDFVAGD